MTASDLTKAERAYGNLPKQVAAVKEHQAMTAQPMPLEETEMYLQQILQHDPVDAAGVISIGCDAAANRGRIIRSALHHLEAGKRARLQALNQVLVILNTEPLGYRTEGEHQVTEGLMDRLVSKVCALAKTEEPQG